MEVKGTEVHDWSEGDGGGKTRVRNRCSGLNLLGASVMQLTVSSLCVAGRARAGQAGHLDRGVLCQLV